MADVARPIREKAVRKLDEALGSHYVRQEDVARALDELTRILSDRFDAEAEAVAVLGQRLEGPGAARGADAGGTGRAAFASVNPSSHSLGGPGPRRRPGDAERATS